MTLRLIAQRAGIVLLLAWLALEIHELGHLVSYWISGYDAWLSFQRVHPASDVPEHARLWAKPWGPLVSLAVGAVLLSAARRRPHFVLVTASFVNVSFRIFPCLVALALALSGRPKGFSDEGDIALALVEGRTGRVAIILLVLLPALWLSSVAARTYRFERRRALAVLGIYVVSLSVGLIAFRLDAVFGFDR